MWEQNGSNIAEQQGREQPKVYILREVNAYSKDYWNLQSGCRVNMSRCRNFTVFSFVMVSNNNKVRTISECYVTSIV